MTEEYNLFEETPRSHLDSEGLLCLQLNRMAMYRDTDTRKYCSSVETFILQCPRKIRDKGLSKLTEKGLQRGKYSTITEDKLVMYDDLYVFVSELLEKAQMIWRIKTTRTYE